MDKNLLLVKMVEKFPCLYKSDSVEYSRRDFTDRAWCQVSKEIDLSVGDCKEKWKNLRYGFLRSLRPNRDGSSKKRYYMHDEMEFIIPYAKKLRTKSVDKSYNLDDDSDKEHANTENTNDRFEITYVDDDSLNVAESLHSINPRGQVKYFRKERNNSSEDPRRMFLLSLLPEIEEFSENQMKLFRRKVFELLDDINNVDGDYNIMKTEPT